MVDIKSGTYDWDLRERGVERGVGSESRNIFYVYTNQHLYVF
jgi:hypothetical protein